MGGGNLKTFSKKHRDILRIHLYLFIYLQVRLTPYAGALLGYTPDVPLEY